MNGCNSISNEGTKSLVQILDITQDTGTVIRQSLG